MTRSGAAHPLTHRTATLDDLPALHGLIDRAIATLQQGFLSPQQISASRHVMGLDTQLIRDGTYLVVEREGAIVGSGGWSYRATLYGGDQSVVAREVAELDPAQDAARIRAMYTDPACARQGIGRQVLTLCENAARARGFRRAEMMATLAGEPLYRACGYIPIEQVTAGPIDGVSVPLVRMGKAL
ncbi:GNAT family N-acetyltransferase [Novosphingobium piscinae]|uniref:GNAT family N-acetyltransferase n=1 Tax=Novosphingobium piscinae TaxID=1507448 RepID=A0A7X1FXP8_9SPHN|nr:GNAT family N-acetyltransferase [Novosphingobium piscinae]MBC2668868.1 GNAT family N-acetyltransferase [Novosphingobium piscinae]